MLAALAGSTSGTVCGTSGTATNGCSAASIGPLGAHAGSGAVLAATAAAATSAAQTTLHQVRGRGGTVLVVGGSSGVDCGRSSDTVVDRRVHM